jgi:response regulator RpfG family c-di-GMP phosphodiesterase
MSRIAKYIIVDDDPFNNLLCKLQIEITLGKVDICTFEIPEDGLQFIQNEYSNSMMPTILFLDINMPTITGWEFMEQYEKFTERIRKQITIYILSSSVDPRDKDKAKNNKHINGFISKPLVSEMILTLANN